MINSKTIASGILKAIAVLITIAIGLFFIYKIQTILVYLLVALVLAMMGFPIVQFLKKRLKFNHIVATSTALMLFFILVFGFVWMFIPLIMAQGKNLSLLDTQAIKAKLELLYTQIDTFLKLQNITITNLFTTKDIASAINPSLVSDFFNSIITAIGNFGIGMASVFFIAFFFLKDYLLFLSSIKKLIPESHEKQILDSVSKINNLLSRYFIGLLLQLTIVFILYIIVLFIFGIHNALIIAFICAVLNVIPYIGPLIASVVAVILTMLNNLGLDFQTEIIPTSLYVLAGFAIIQFIDNNISQPVIFSRSVSSHPLEIFLVILIVGTLFGIMGMIIAVPLYTIIKVICKTFYPENKIIKLIAKDI